MQLWWFIGIGVFALAYVVHKTMQAGKRVDTFLAGINAEREKRQEIEKPERKTG